MVPVALWVNTVNMGAPAPSSMPPLGSMTHSRTRPVFTVGAIPAISDHSTLPLPAPVAPAISTWWPSRGTCHQWRFSVIPIGTARNSTAVVDVGMGRSTGSASTSPRMRVMRSSAGAVERIVIRSARQAAASASACLCQSVTDWPVMMRSCSASVVLPMCTDCKVGTRVRSPRRAVSPCRVHTDSQVRL